MPFSNLQNRREDSVAVHILLVSGNGGFREQLRDRLAPLRWDLVEAKSGSEALELLHMQAGTEVLLLDPLLPDLLPAEFCGMVRQRYPNIEILTMNTNTGHVLVGSSSPTPFASQLAELLYQGTSSPALKPAAPIPEYHRSSKSGPGLRGMVGRFTGHAECVLTGSHGRAS